MGDMLTSPMAADADMQVCPPPPPPSRAEPAGPRAARRGALGTRPDPCGRAPRHSWMPSPRPPRPSPRPTWRSWRRRPARRRFGPTGTSVRPPRHTAAAAWPAQTPGTDATRCNLGTRRHFGKHGNMKSILLEGTPAVAVTSAHSQASGLNGLTRAQRQQGANESAGD
jgi:hypothetical protein